MVKQHHAEGYDEFIKLLDGISVDTKVVLYFSGQVNEKGENWCPDCQVAEPIVDEVIKEYEDRDFEFIHASVGSREQWKKPDCQFRTDPRFKLTSVPTLMIYKAVERLNDVECQDKENIRALLEDLPKKEKVPQETKIPPTNTEPEDTKMVKIDEKTKKNTGKASMEEKKRKFSLAKGGGTPKKEEKN